MNRVDGAALHGAEQLARGNQLVCIEQLDLHAVPGDVVEHLDCGVDHVLGQCRAGIGLHPPLDRRLGQGGRRQCSSGRGCGPFQKCASVGHSLSPLVGFVLKRTPSCRRPGFGRDHLLYTYSGSHNAICGKVIMMARANVITMTKGRIEP